MTHNRIKNEKCKRGHRIEKENDPYKFQIKL